ncbi:hypothetical protein GCM10023115_24860 [Pontixanthobacter gangjinensis]|uniref:HNH endonuclease n=1 Tax=Christiangramia aestuarii TaxID=1028746 RepID=A0A7K1LTF7_9FLAO|nr:hypothetical protein [Christiangramia aestuarii]MUP43881.1 hypothetical protein [Christiangramia aestuarii]
MENHSILNSKGEIVFFNLDQFKKDIIEGKCCFICGAKPGSKKFNNEHVIPNWILKRFNLHSEKINLTNGTKIKYGHYKVPCCQECNTELGKTYEIPISKLLDKNYNEVIEELNRDKEKIKLLYLWLCLIYFKTYLKDNYLRADQKLGENSPNIGDEHYWEDMHHIHCMARSHYTNAIIHPDVFGTILIYPSISDQNYDYVDSHLGKTVMLELDDFCIIVNLNDACAGKSVFYDQLIKIKGPLNKPQNREIISNLNFINLSLKQRPIFKSLIDNKGDYHIIVELPEKWYLLKEEERLVSSPGQFLRRYVEPIMGEFDGKKQILQDLENNRRSYLFNEKGEFTDYSNN